jgi:hypothetical protein
MSMAGVRLPAFRLASASWSWALLTQDFLRSNDAAETALLTMQAREPPDLWFARLYLMQRC